MSNFWAWFPVHLGVRRSVRQCYDKYFVQFYRCDATEFKPSKSHKKLLKKVAKFLNDTAGTA